MSETASDVMIAKTSGVQVRMALICVLLTVFGGAMSALVYARLVEIKEGTGISKLAEVFA